MRLGTVRLDRVKVIAEMARKDKTSVRLSEETGVARATISGIRSGKSCNESTAKIIAFALGVTVADLKEEQ